MSVDIENIKKLLLARRDELLQLSGISADDRATVTLDQSAVGRLSRMDALQRQAMAQARERARATDLVRINQALQRIAQDEYGYCDRCGEEIPAKRLEIDPMAVVCVKCAASR